MGDGSSPPNYFKEKINAYNKNLYETVRLK